MDKLRKKLREEFEENVKIDDSDIPVHERYVEERNIRIARKLKKNI